MPYTRRPVIRVQLVLLSDMRQMMSWSRHLVGAYVAITILVLCYSTQFLLWNVEKARRDNNYRNNNITITSLVGSYTNDTGNETLAGTTQFEITNSTEYLETNNQEPKLGNTIVYAHYRTGSTFASEFLFRRQDVAFMFEPLYLTKYQDFVSDGQNILWDMLNCRFRNESYKRIDIVWRYYSLFCHINNQTPGCRHGKVMPLKQIEAHCKQAAMKVCP